MILTCPECKSRYVVNPSALLPQGRTVRCAKCSHSWFESEPQDDVEIIPPGPDDTADENPQEEAKDDSKDNVVDKDKSSEADKAAAEQGSDAVDDDFDFPISNPRKRRRPIPKGSNLPALQNQKYGSNKLGWISLAIFITAMISSFMIFQQTISDYWPASKKLYHAIGLDGTIAEEVPAAAEIDPVEERLSINGITPKRETINNVSHLVIEGYVENITDEQQTIPALKVILLDENRKNIREWSFMPETTVVEASEKVDFVTSLPSPPPEARDISVTFTTN